ncbi:MAG: MFS transporter, partial [Sphingomonadaceae bacterium]
MERAQQRSPWAWIPTLYFGQAIPYVVVMILSTVMYKNMGISNTDMALYTGWLYLPWVIKPLWSPLVELVRTKRLWIVSLQLLIGAALAMVALTTHLPQFFQFSLALLWLMAFSSATHDIAADGFYMLGLSQHQQAAFVGVRSTFYKLAMIAGQGGLVFLAGKLTEATGDVASAWSAVFIVLAVVFLGLCVYHHLMLPRPVADQPHAAGGALWQDFLATFRSFFQKPGILVILGFLLLFRLGEAQLLKMAVPFLLDPASKGGLGLTTADVGLVYGTIGVMALILGGLLGGMTIARFGLRRCLWLMVFAVHVPDLVVVYLAT